MGGGGRGEHPLHIQIYLIYVCIYYVHACVCARLTRYELFFPLSCSLSLQLQIGTAQKYATLFMKQRLETERGRQSSSS